MNSNPLIALIVLLGLLVTRTAFGEPIANELSTEKLAGEGVWVMPALQRQTTRGIRVTVWFEDQFLGKGDSYQRRAKEFATSKRRQLRDDVITTLKSLSRRSFTAAKPAIDELLGAGSISQVERHWIVNGFSCNVSPGKIGSLKQIPGVRKIFMSRSRGVPPITKETSPTVALSDRKDFDSNRYLHPWYTRSLLADQVWDRLGVTGQNTLNVISDSNFDLSKTYSINVYRNDREIPANGKDDDGNGLIDDFHGYNFANNSAKITTRP
ncbi:MAG: hypothetical protein AAGI63_19685, partial [Planctomycetota bacterium]